MSKFYYDVALFEGRYSVRAVSEHSTTVYADKVVASFENEAEAYAEADRLQSIYDEKNKPYTDNGYENRKDYLNSLADEYGIERQTVYTLASMLGSSEDFDGLVSSLEDMVDY